MSSKHIRVAVVGLGKMGMLHSCILKVIPNVEVTALCERNGIMRRFLKKVFTNPRIVDDVEKLVDLELDAVYVTTPISSHFPIVKTIYLNNIAHNVFVEKTLASNYREAQEMCDLANRSGGVNMVGYLRRFYVTFRKAKELLSQATIGEISSFEAYAYSSDFCEMKQEASTYATMSDALKDLGCYAVDLALWFFGDLQVSSAAVKSLSTGHRGYYVDFTVDDFKGLKGKFRISRCMEGYRMPEVGLSIVGAKGRMMVNDDKVELKSSGNRTLVWYRHDLSDNVPFWLGLPEYYREDLHFVKSVYEGRMAEPTFSEASNVDEIISQIEKNAGENNE